MTQITKYDHPNARDPIIKFKRQIFYFHVYCMYIILYEHFDILFNRPPSAPLQALGGPHTPV